MVNQDENVVINAIIKENLTKLLAIEIPDNEIKIIKEKIRQKLKNPRFSIKTNKIAEALIFYLINTRKIQNQYDLDKFIIKSGFLRDHCVIRDFSFYEEKNQNTIQVDPEILEMVDTKSISKAHKDLMKTQVVQDLIEEEAEKRVELERQQIEKYKSFIDDDLDRPDDELILEIEEQREFPYLEKDFEWYKEIGLKSDPFPSREGLELIDQNLYDLVVTQTPIFKKYIRTLNSNANLLLNKSIIIYGEWGCGKTTFFDYFGYKCLEKDLFPIQVLLNAEGSLQKLKDAFRNELFRKMAEYVSQISTTDPRSYLQRRDEDDIIILFEMIQKEYKKHGFFIFLDGLHKSQDEQNIPLKFLNELQNILGIFKRRGIPIGIFIAGSFDWKQNISYNPIFSGSIYQDEKMPGINENQAYDMLNKRLSAFSETDIQFITYPDIQRLFNTIKKSRATEIPFRILIQEFLARGFVSEKSIKFDLRIEKDILQTIDEILKENTELYKILQMLALQCDNEVSKFLKIQNVISSAHERRIYEDDTFLSENKAVVQLLLKKGIVKKFYDKEKKQVFYWLKTEFWKTFKKIEKRVKYSPRYYLDKILCKKQVEIKEVEDDFDKNIATLERWIHTNPQFETNLNKIIHEINQTQIPLISKIENNNFEITTHDLELMDDSIFNLLDFLYLLSEEPYPIKDKKQMFNVFRLTWLDNEELTFFLNARDNYKRRVSSTKEQNQHFLKIYKDAFNSQVFKIGRYLNYNNVLKVGSNELTDYEKRILNQARAIYEDLLYKKSVERYFDLIEVKSRDWLFNIMNLLFNSNWKNFIPHHFKLMINKYKSSDKVKFGTQIHDENELYYLPRDAYAHFFLNRKLWNVYFSWILGSDNKDIIAKLAKISSIANKVKHNQKDEDLKKLAPNIKEGLINTRDILMVLNRGYKNVLDPLKMLIQDKKLFMCWSPQVDLNIVEPFEINDKKVDEILDFLEEFLNKEVPVHENFIDVGNSTSILQTFSTSYREFIAIICYLIKSDKIRIKDQEGSSFLFELIKS